MNSKVILSVLALFVFYLASTQGVSLRCQCIKTNSKFIHPRRMENIEIFPSGPHCSNVEIIATLKNGTPVCLNPEAAWVKKVIDMMIKNAEKTES